MDISIIIVNYNTKKETSECITSCLKEGSSCKIEINVIDNASDDGSVLFLRKYFNKNKNVHIFENKYNDGFSKAVNFGLKYSKGKYKYLLNSDTLVDKFTFSKVIGFAKKDKRIGVIGTRLLLPDGTIQKSCFNFPNIINVIREFWFGQKETFTPFYKNKIAEVDAVVGASFCITPQAYAKVGYFDERYFMYFEDIDYCKRVRKLGFKVIYFPEAKVLHYHGLSGKNVSSDDEQWRRLIPSSKIYHGVVKHYLINFVIWSGNKIEKLIN